MTTKTASAPGVIAGGLLQEFDLEMAATRQVLEAVPEQNLAWKPHDKSMTLSRLAAHVAQLPGWTGIMLAQDEFDVDPPGGSDYTPAETESRAKLLESFDATVEQARELIGSTSDRTFLKPWTLKKGGKTLFTAPRVGVLRRQMLNHLIHHRGQLTVYLRLRGVKVPQTFGPTADYPDFEG